MHGKKSDPNVHLIQISFDTQDIWNWEMNEFFMKMIESIQVDVCRSDLFSLTVVVFLTFKVGSVNEPKWQKIGGSEIVWRSTPWRRESVDQKLRSFGEQWGYSMCLGLALSLVLHSLCFATVYGNTFALNHSFWSFGHFPVLYPWLNQQKSTWKRPIFMLLLVCIHFMSFASSLR